MKRGIEYANIKVRLMVVHNYAICTILDLKCLSTAIYIRTTLFSFQLQFLNVSNDLTWVIYYADIIYLV